MNGRVVVDASLAIKWVIDEPYTDEARSLLIDWEQRVVDRIVPVLFLSEINTPLLRRRRDESLSMADVELARVDVLAAVMVVAEDADLAARALAIADHLALWNGYDSLYAALAERERCEYWTCDERFWNVAREFYPWVPWVGEAGLPTR
jgi:predicted nucleic acid-binding protein